MDHGVCRTLREPVQGGPASARQPPVRSKRRGGVAEEMRLVKRYDCGDYCGYATQTRLAIFNKTQTTSLILPCARGLEKSFCFYTFSLHFRYAHPITLNQ